MVIALRRKEEEEMKDMVIVIDEKPEPIADQHRSMENSSFKRMQESKIAVEEILAKMVSAKKEGQPKSQLRELATQMLLHFVALRQTNRSILMEEDRVKAETEDARASVDFQTLQLQSLMYEKNHYLKAIKAGQDFRSIYPDIELAPVEEMFHVAPEGIKSATMSNDCTHNLMLKRLNFELFQRKELCKLHKRLERRKRSLSDTIANRKKFLSSLPSHLKSLKKACLPAQNQLGVQHLKNLKQHHFVELLPHPLFVLYSQFLAQKEAFGESIDLEIVGSLKDAQALAHQQANKGITCISTNAESSKLEDDAEGDDDQRNQPNKRVRTDENCDQAGMYQVHPLKAILHVFDDISDLNIAKLITLKFEYLLKLNVVCVGVEEPDNNILCDLFPDDNGLELPLQSAKLCTGDAHAFDGRGTSRPYKWAQHLAGIDFLPEVSPLLTDREAQMSETTKSDAVISSLSLFRQHNRVQTVVQRIRARKKAQVSLCEPLQ